MALINKVGIHGIRGIDREVEIKGRTLVTGPNGSGKSAIPVAIDFALLGLVPGYKKNETFANASNEAMMRGVVEMGDHTIERTLTQGKTLMERITIDDGTPADPKAATPMLELILGKEPPVLNMPAFWACTSTEKRRMLLRLVADAKTQKELAKNEERVRDTKKEKTRVRQVAEKAIESMTKRLASLEKPTGNLDHMRKEIEELTAQIRETEKKVADGEAAEKTRDQLSSNVKSIASLKKQRKKLEAEKITADNELQAIQKGIKVHEENAQASQKATISLPKGAIDIIEQAVSDLDDVDLNPLEDLGLHGIIRSIRDSLKSLLPNPEAEAERQKVDKERTENLTALKEQYRETQNCISGIDSELAKTCATLKVAQKAEKDLDKLGDPADPKDVAALQGMNSRRSELEAKIDPLVQIEAVTREIENARLDAEKALAEEDVAKKELEEAIKAQQIIVEQAAEELARRSKTILPSGNLRLEDDGKDITIYWAKSDTLRVQRTTLSGGEQALFDCALGHALAPGALVCIEGAEIDDDRMVEVMEHIPEGPFQVMLLTCHPPKKVPKGWHHIELSD